eukprot:360905-Chlamydomonas_euryale.AAC.2
MAVWGAAPTQPPHNVHTTATKRHGVTHQQHRCRQRQWWRDILHDLAPPRAIRRAVAEKHRYVRPNVARPLKQLRVARRTARQLVGRPQRCRGVAAAAAEAGPVRHLRKCASERFWAMRE